MAGYAATIYAFVGEFMSDKNRASIISWVSTSIGLASIIDPLLCRWILSYDWSYELYDGYFFRPWRLLIIIFSLTGILSSLLILTVPESPKFYLEQNEKQKAMDVMRWMYRVNKRTKSLENFKVDEIETERSKVIGEYHKGM
jgi:MFS transporter, VNT family, synaptic vesicle glycoprotein 2